ncbi:tRNA(Ile)-lysidine synthase [Candidatus Methanobinarius endosymbioticus]|uniref:tRNA(Ile)-lysidine synthase n=1 Tax=Candidatus Methanobinarius endosymbioticus TaxID=2006182 RepID=A0A366MED6_9EURY|nr:tRNA(Ile)-lysidine synthase [Candidatus Methanobinarius endosymbioticus]
MKLVKEDLIKHVKKIRKELDHDDSDININEIIYNSEKDEMWIITPDRPDKSIVIGKGGWVVGRLREELHINRIHVESYSDYILKKYRMELSLETVNSFINKEKQQKIDDKFKKQKNNTKKSEHESLIKPMENLKSLLEERIKNVYNFSLDEYFNQKNDFIINNSNNNSDNENKNKINESKIIIALSGGVDSSFSLALAKKLGFNPTAITIDPGTIVLPKQFKDNINKLCDDLEITHKYIQVNYDELINDSLNGRFHPCGRCSDIIEETLFNYGIKNNIDMVIFGDMLSTGSQCIIKYNLDFDTFNNILNAKNIENKKNKEIFRLNLPATLSIGKEEIRNTVEKYNLEKIKGFGCPLLYEVHKKYPYLKKFSIQRILRETRAGALEPGEALNLIWSFYKA